ncbi:YsnF/AvaK domain-containing protein [Paracoccus gahaiensis]|nr:YsnF/AvaK domain-containing protein [Paracoccus gahaiensis]
MADDRDDAVLPVMEERLTITKDRRMTGRVRVSTSTETIDSTLPVELSGTEVHVVRVPIDRRIDEVPEITTSGELTIIPVVEERMVMTRELYLREEIHIRRIDFQDTQEVPVSVRRQTAHVEHLDPDEPGTAPLPSPSKDDRNDL